MNWAIIRNLQQALTLDFRQITRQLKFSIDSIEESHPRFAVGTIFGMNSVMLKLDEDLLQIDSFTLRVKPERH